MCKKSLKIQKSTIQLKTFGIYAPLLRDSMRNKELYLLQATFQTWHHILTFTWNFSKSMLKRPKMTWLYSNNFCKLRLVMKKFQLSAKMPSKSKSLRSYHWEAILRHSRSQKNGHGSYTIQRTLATSGILCAGALRSSDWKKGGTLAFSTTMMTPWKKVGSGHKKNSSVSKRK